MLNKRNQSHPSMQYIILLTLNLKTKLISNGKNRHIDILGRCRLNGTNEHEGTPWSDGDVLPSNQATDDVCMQSLNSVEMKR